MNFAAEPFPHWVADGAFPAGLVAAAAADWPAPDWPHWVRYASAVEDKRACHLWHELPAACYQMLERLLHYPVRLLTGEAAARPDPGLWGAGLHETPAGGALGVHLDAACHPRTGRGRLLTAVLFLNAGAGGELVLCGPDRRPAEAVAPAPGRLCVFRNTAAAWHGVAPWRGPGPRRTLACFWYGDPAPAGARARALFDGDRTPWRDTGPA